MKRHSHFFSTFSCSLVVLLVLTANLQAQQWSATSALGTARVLHSSTLLANGKVLVVGGTGAAATSAELYDPATGNWTATGSLTTARYTTSPCGCRMARCWSRAAKAVIAEI